MQNPLTCYIFWTRQVTSPRQKGMRYLLKYSILVCSDQSERMKIFSTSVKIAGGARRYRAMGGRGARRISKLKEPVRNFVCRDNEIFAFRYTRQSKNASIFN